MFNKVHVPVAGIVQNMAYFQCPGCSVRSQRVCGPLPTTSSSLVAVMQERHYIFGDNGAKRLAEELHLPLLGLRACFSLGAHQCPPLRCVVGDVPLAMAIREGADTGQPIVVSQPDSPQACA